MIDLSFLTEAEQEAILKVLNRDAELKKTEDERLRHLHDAVDDENEYKSKSGQWFYEAKSKRHREKIHGVDLVRASIRKRKKPATIELYGVMEPPDEAEEDIKVKKEEGNRSLKTVGVTSPEKDQVNQKNGAIVTPAKPRQNPFNSGGLQDYSDYNNRTSNLSPQNGQVNGTPKTKADLMSSLSKYGVKLPYPELIKGSEISQKADDDSQQQTVQTPVRKPRTLKMHSELQDQPSFSIKKEDSYNDASKPRGILKRRSSTSSTDSESLRLSQSAESSKIVLSGSTILQAGRNNFSDESDAATDNSSDRLKQVRFSEKVHQRPPTPNPEPYSSKEIGEYGILDPGLSGADLKNVFGDHHDSGEPLSEHSKIFEPKDILESLSRSMQPASLEVERNLEEPVRNSEEPDEGKSKMNERLIKPKTSFDISIELPTNNSTGDEPLYATVTKTPKAPSSGQERDFDLDDALMEPRFHPQRGKNITSYQSERPMEFGKSYAGEGKIAFESNYPEMQLKEKYSFSKEDENTATTCSNLENSPGVPTQNDNFESVALWRQPSILRDQEHRSPSPDITEEPKSLHTLQDISKVKDPSHVQNLPRYTFSPGDYSGESKYRSMFLRNSLDVEPDGLKNNLPVAQNDPGAFKTGQAQYNFLRENKGRNDLPKSAHFKVMSLNERSNVVPSEQMSNPSQFQSLKHFWNVEEKNPTIRDTDTSPNNLLTDFLSRNKSAKAELQQRNSHTVSSEDVILPDTFDSLSEEEQTSHKVASWLAQTPAMDEVHQMDHNEDQMYLGDEMLEHVQTSPVVDKSVTAVQNPRDVVVEAPRIAEAGELNTEDMRVVPHEKRNMDHQLATVKVSPVSQTSLETKPHSADSKVSSNGFYDRMLQINSKQSPVKETMLPKKQSIGVNLVRASAPTKSANEYSVGFENFKDDFASSEAFHKEKMPERSVAEEVIKSVAPESRDKQDFISALKKLEIEDLNPPSPKVEVATEETVEKLEAPKSRGKQDFIDALNKLEIEASPHLPTKEVEHQDNLPEEEIQQHAVSSVDESFKIGFENFAPPDDAYEPFEDQSVQFQSLQTYPHNKENRIVGLAEPVDKTSVASQKNEKLANALRMQELEALEHHPVDDVPLTHNVEIKSPMTLQTNLIHGYSVVEESSIKEEKNVHEVKQSPNSSSAFQQKSHGDIDEENRPVVDEVPTQRVIVDTQQSSADFHNRRMRLEEAATIPEEPEDLVEDNMIKVSEFPNGEVNISKKVYSSFESLPPVRYPAEAEKSAENALYSPMSKAKELDLKTEKRADYHRSPLEYSGSYTEGTENVLYEKPEVGSLEVSSSKQGKPALTENASDASPSKHDKYMFEVMKAQDESISKVLDWFNRSSDIGNDATLTVGKEYKDKTSQFLSGAKVEIGDDKNDMSGNVLLMKVGSNSEVPLKFLESDQSRLSSSTEFFDHNIASAEQVSPVNLLKDKSVPAGSPLKYGNSGSGYGKISNQTIRSVQKDTEVQEANYVDVFEEDKNVNAELDGILVVSLVSPSKIPESSEKPPSQSSLGNAENRPNIQKDERDFTENTSPRLPFNTKLEAINGLDFDLREGECYKDSNLDISELLKSQPMLPQSNKEELDHDLVVVPTLELVHIMKEQLTPSEIMHSNLETSELPSSLEIPEESEMPHSRFSTSSTENGNDCSDVQRYEGLAQSDITKNSSSPLEQVNSKLEAGNILEFGKSGGGSGKTSSQEISEVSEMPQFRSSLSSTESMNSDRTDVLNVAHSPACLVEHKGVPPEQIHSDLEANELPSSQEISQILEKPHLHVSVAITENANDNSDIKDKSLTPSNDNTPEQIHSNLHNGNIPAFGNNEVRSGNELNQDISEIFGNSQSGSPLSCTIGIDHAEVVNVEPSQAHIMEGKLVSIKQIHEIPVATELQSSLAILENSGKPHSQFSLGSTENTDDYSNLEKDGLLTANFIENTSPPEDISEKLGARDVLVSEKCDGSGKMANQGIPIAFKKLPSSSPLRNTKSMSHDHAEELSIEQPPAEIGKELGSPEQIRSALKATESPSRQDIPEKFLAQFSVGSAENTNGNPSYIQEDEYFTPSSITENSSSPERILNLEAGEFLQFGKSGGGSGKILNRNISDVRERSSLTTTGGMNYNAEVLNVKSSSAQIGKDESVPNEQMHTNHVPSSLVKSEKCESGFDKMSNQSADDTETNIHSQEVENLPVLPENQEMSLLEQVAPAEDRAGVSDNSITEKEKLDTLESQDLNQKLVKPDSTQKKVGEIKLLWEGERSSQPPFKIMPNQRQRTFSNVSTLSRNSSLECDDQLKSSLVAFKKVMVEDEEILSPPIDQLKYFWENEAKKETVNVKPQDKSSAASADLTNKVRRLTLNSFFEKEQGTGEKNLSGRSMSESMKDLPKSATFQSLKSFWNVDNQSKSNCNDPNDRLFLESKKRLFRSNPDLSKESYVAKIKSKLDSKSSMDIREVAPTISHFQSNEVKYDAKHRSPCLRKITKEKSDNSSSDFTEAPESSSLVSKDLSLKTDSIETLPTERPPSKVFEIDSDLVVKVDASKSQRPNEQSRTLKNLRNKYETSSSPKDTKKGENNGEIYLNESKHRQKPVLVQQTGFDAAKSPEDDSFVTSKSGNSGAFGGSCGFTQTTASQEVHETFEKTIATNKKASGNFDQALQKPYNECLGDSLATDVKLNRNENMDMERPEENFSKVLTVSSGRIERLVQRNSSKDSPTSSHQPIVIDLSSKKMNAGKDSSTSKVDRYVTVEFSSPDGPSNGASPDRPTFEQNVNQYNEIKGPVMLAGENENKDIDGEELSKEFVERIEMPTIHPKAQFNYFEDLKKLCESRDLTPTLTTASIANVDAFQVTPANRKSFDESAASGSQVVDILKPEVMETTEKTNAPPKMSFVKSLEKLQKQATNDEPGPCMEHMPSNHETLMESQPKFSENSRVAGNVSESPTTIEAPEQEKMDEPQCEALNTPFTDRQSTPVKEEDGSLRRSTLELLLAAPYRKQIFKSMHSELDGKIASDAIGERYPLNSSNPQEHLKAPTENSFPENAEKFKRMSQSVPTFLQDETDGRDTDSASESSFQLGRHRKSPSSLTNLSVSSGMASMSSVNGSVMSVYSGDFGNVDVKGGIEFSIDYVEQLKEFLIYIYQCRDLAAADVKRQRSDPYVKAYLLPEKAKMGKRKTAVKKKTLNPVYNEILRYKIPKEALLAQTLNLSVWHHDALGRNSFLGEVSVNLATWNWGNALRSWHQLEPRTPAAAIGLENRGEIKLALKYVPLSLQGSGSKQISTGEVHIWIKECLQLPMLRDNKINSFVKCTVLPDTSRKSRQKTRTVDKTTSPIFNHTMVYDGFKEEDLREACVELTVWDHNRLSNHFLGGLRVGLGTGKSYGTAVDWMDSSAEESTMWEKMMTSPNTWIEGLLPLRMFKMAKLSK